MDERKIANRVAERWAAYDPSEPYPPAMLMKKDVVYFVFRGEDEAQKFYHQWKRRIPRHVLMPHQLESQTVVLELYDFDWGWWDDLYDEAKRAKAVTRTR